MQENLFIKGGFFVGCNYWASHAGIFMWRDWNEAVVEEDLKRLAENGVQVLRVFPLWPDFQPLRMHRGGAQEPYEPRMGEDPLPDTEAGRAGLDETMLDRFASFAALAEKYGLKLIVGLLTGWMSGRMFVPEMFDGVNVLTDPIAIEWELKFVRCFVRRFRDASAIAAWDLGNECNCMAHVPNRAAFYCWVAAISMAIRTEDDTRPVVSGMHGLRIEGQATPKDQGELLDVLTTHPYPLFTPHCDTDPLNRMKSALHATAESRYYADLSGVPCFAEEVGNLGPMICSEENAAAYATASMMTLWAHDCRGFLWWCAWEQSHLTATPYDWCAVERELGLFRGDKTPKPVLKALSRFSDFVKNSGAECLPENLTDAVCVLTPGQDTWAAAYGAFLLAKKAHLDLRFADGDSVIPAAPAYLVPSIKGSLNMPRRNIYALLDRVREGATLYLSLDDCLLSPFREVTGLRVLTRSKNTASDRVEMDGADYELTSAFRLRTESCGAEILARNDRGDPVFTEYRLGKGRVFCLLYPVEYLAATVPGIVDGDNAQALEKFYEALRIENPQRTAKIDCPTVGLTEHAVNANEHLLTLINYEPEAQSARLSLTDGWKAVAWKSMDDAAALNGETVSLPGNSGMLVRVRQTD